ncbi:MAG TPA: LysM peptidoglycan-binding domain-containing protein [Cyclobacteriaceae bacterium]|nr:LysM peptidoglycan-binding domain-containing protein [Cyclobacteriaceae bacterium]
MIYSEFRIQDKAVVPIFLSCILCLVSIMAGAIPPDSLRLETINGKQFIIHQVDPKETLYSISRKYGVAVALIRDENPVADGGLSVGQLIRVPYIPKTKPKTENGVVVHKVNTKETLFSISRLYDVSIDDIKLWNNLKDNGLNIGQDLVIRKKTITEAARLPEMKAIRGMHKVTDKETLFSISKMYGASIEQLKTWNDLSSDEVKLGQILYVVQPMYMQEKAEQPDVKQSTQVTKPATGEVKISEAVIGSDEVHEKGAAELIEGTDGNRKYLAQHKTAKVGTIMKVRNEATNREVFVRIAGPLTTDGNTVIKVSKSAFDRLGATDPKFNVELIYYK